MGREISIKDIRRGDLIKVYIDGNEFLPAVLNPKMNIDLLNEGVTYLAMFHGFRYIFDVQAPMQDRMSTCETFKEVPDNADRIQLILKHKGHTREFYIPNKSDPKIYKYKHTLNLYRLLYF